MSTIEERNKSVFTEMEAIIEKIGYGSIDWSMGIHGKKITSLTVYGKKRNVYNKTKEEQDKAMLDILARIKQTIDTKQDSKITFVVDITRGNILEIFWHSQLRRNYQELDKSAC